MTVKRVRKLKVERALALDVWTRMRTTLAERAALLGPEGARWRAALARLVAGRRRDASELAARGDWQRHEAALRAGERRMHLLRLANSASHGHETR